MQNARYLKYVKKKTIIYILFLILAFQVFLGIKLSSFRKYFKTNQIAKEWFKHDGINSNISLNYKCPLPGDTKDALQRASSFLCKQSIIDTVCSKHSLYSPSYETSCPLLKNFKKLGCFVEQPQSEDIKHETISFDDNSHEKCVFYCLNRQYTFAHVMNEKICHCGFSYNSFGSVTGNDSMFYCNLTQCPGNKEEDCGTKGSAITLSTGFFNKSILGVKTRFDTFNQITPVNVTKIRIVFVLILNGRADRQVLRLLRAIYNPYHYYLIHVDSRQDYLYNRLLSVFSDSSGRMPSNLKFSRKRFAPIWGGTSLLEVLLNCLQQLILNSDWRWDYFVNMSESDFILRTLDELVNVLTLNNGTNFVRGHQGSSSARFIKRQGMEFLFHECDDHLWRLDSKPLVSGLAFDGASDWLILTKEFSQFLVLGREPMLIGLKAFFSQSLLPAESFFQTILLNSHFCTRYVTDNLHHIKWRRPSGCNCEYKKFVDWCGCSPHDFRLTDTNRLTKERQFYEFIGRKFEAVVDQTVVKEVETNLFGSQYTDITNIDSYWYNLYSMRYDGPKSPLKSSLAVYSATFDRLLEKSLGWTECLEKEKSSFRYYNLTTTLEDINLYYFADVKQGILATYRKKVVWRSSIFALTRVIELRAEGYFKRKIDANQKKSPIFTKFEVGESPDFKEGIFRNHASMLGTDADIRLLITLDPSALKAAIAEKRAKRDVKAVGKNGQKEVVKPLPWDTKNLDLEALGLKELEDPDLFYEVTVEIEIDYVWVSPAGQIVHVDGKTYTETDVDKDALLHAFFKPDHAKKPYLPGIWSVFAIYRDNASIIHEEKFLILPHDLMDHVSNSHSVLGTFPQYLNRLLDLAKDASYHHISAERLASLTRILHLPDQSSRLLPSAPFHPRGPKLFEIPKFPRDLSTSRSYYASLREQLITWHHLNAWIDDLTSRMWTVENVCFVEPLDLSVLENTCFDVMNLEAFLPNVSGTIMKKSLFCNAEAALMGSHHWSSYSYDPKTIITF